jgi:hypothetical protein
MHVKRSASRWASQGEIASDDTSSGGHEQFVISPRSRRVIRKVARGGEGSSTRADEEDARIAEGHAMVVAREARASDIIQKVERLLKPNFEYTLRRVDRHNQSEDTYEWTIELHDHRFWSNFQADWYISIIKDRKNPITSQLYVDWTYMQKKRDPVFHKVIVKAQKLGIFDMLCMYQEWNTELVAQFCATAWRNGHGYEKIINFGVEGHRLSVRLMELLTIFILADNDFHRTEIITERTIAKNELAPLYMPGNESNYGTT